MPVTIPNIGGVRVLEQILNKESPENIRLRLFQSDNTPPQASSIASSFVEATFQGYTAKTLTGSSWVITPGNPSKGDYARQSFVSTATQTQTIYGYYLTQVTSNVLLFAEQFSDGPFVITKPGDEIRINLSVSLADLLD